MNWFVIVLNILELSACITGFIYWSKIKDTYWKWFPVYLAVVFLTEIVAEYVLHGKKLLGLNIDIYSYFGIPLEYFFLYWLFYQQFKDTNKRIWPLISAAVFFISLVSDLSYISSIKFYFESFSNTVGCLFLSILLLMYFNRFVKTDEIIHYKTSMMFWVSLGLMLFYIGTIPFFAFRKLLYVEHRDFFYIYWYIQFGLNYLMYLLFILSFIWGKPK